MKINVSGSRDEEGGEARYEKELHKDRLPSMSTVQNHK